MILCTECYIQRSNPSGSGSNSDSQTLMLHRNKKHDDINEGKWVGLGGKFETGESPEQCLVREVREEAGVTLNDYQLRGMVTFLSNDMSDEALHIFIFTASSFTGEIDFGNCKEGTLQWVDSGSILDLNLWEGDRLFWNWMTDSKTSDKLFSARFVYDGERLIEHDVTFY